MPAVYAKRWESRKKLYDCHGLTVHFVPLVFLDIICTYLCHIAYRAKLAEGSKRSVLLENTIINIMTVCGFYLTIYMCEFLLSLLVSLSQSTDFMTVKFSLFQFSCSCGNEMDMKLYLVHSIKSYVERKGRSG